jgi:hypothetical protein
MGLENTGVNLVAQNSQAFESALARAKGAVQNFVGTAQTSASNLSGFNVISGALAVTLGNILSSAIKTVGSDLVDAAKSSVLTAGRFDELTSVAEMLGSRTGESKAQVDGLIASIREYGIEGGVAANLVAQFSRYNLDLSKSTELARIAQDAAVLTQQNSSDALAGLLWGVETYNQRILRTYGLNVDMSQAFERYAKAIGTTTDALTEDQKVQAALNGVIEEGARIQGVYALAMESPAKQLRSLPRLANDMAIAVGEPFQKAFGTGIKAIADLVKAGTAAFSEGGALYPAITALGHNVDSLAQHFIDLASYAANSTGNLNSNVGDRLTELVNNSFAWGYNLVDNFGSGMIQGAAAVINALAFIGNLISGQLESHSPPKLLPNLANWGKAAMASYMAGWAKADFSVFDEIAGTVESSLRATAGSKDTGLVSKILGDRSAIAGALETVRSVGEVTDQVMSKLYAKTHITDSAMRDYLKTTLELAVANDKVTAAQDALNAITKKYDDLLKPLQKQQEASATAADNMDDQRKITQLQMVLNDVNATAADKERAKLEIQKLQTGIQIRNIEQQKTAETDAAQTALDNATAQRDAILAQQEAAKALVAEHTHENELLKQQKDLLDALAKASEQASKAMSGGGGGKAPKVAVQDNRFATGSKNWLKNVGVPEGTAGVTTANPFAGIKKSLDDLTAAISNLNKAWAPATGASKPFFNWITTNLPTITKFMTVFLVVSGVLAGIVGIVAAVGGALLGLSNPVTAVILVVGLAAAVWATWGDKISAWATNTFNKITEWAANTGTKLQTWRDETAPKISGWVTDTQGKINTWETNTSKTISGWVTDTGKSIGGWVTDTQTNINTWETNTGQTISTWATDARTTITTWISDTGKDFGDWASSSYQKAVDWAKNIVDGLVQGIKDNWKRFKSYFTGLINGLIDDIKEKLGISSPSKVFAALGANMMLGLAKGIADNTALPQLALQASIGGTVSHPGGGTVNHVSSSYHYNPIYQLTMQTVQQPRSVARSFEMMRLLGGG